MRGGVIFVSVNEKTLLNSSQSGEHKYVRTNAVCVISIIDNALIPAIDDI